MKSIERLSSPSYESDDNNDGAKYEIRDEIYAAKKVTIGSKVLVIESIVESEESKIQSNIFYNPSSLIPGKVVAMADKVVARGNHPLQKP